MNYTVLKWDFGRKKSEVWFKFDTPYAVSAAKTRDNFTIVITDPKCFVSEQGLVVNKSFVVI